MLDARSRADSRCWEEGRREGKVAPGAWLGTAAPYRHRHGPRSHPCLFAQVLPGLSSHGPALLQETGT